jgi:hypothetical protein
MDTKSRPGINPGELLWQNVALLARHKYKTDRFINKLAADSKVGNASIMRIKEMRTAHGLRILQSVATALGVDLWQLFLPELTIECAAKQRTLVQVCNRLNENRQRKMLEMADELMAAQNAESTQPNAS